MSTIAVGLVVHWRGAALPSGLRDGLGDALWAMMISWWVGFLVPGVRAGWRAAVALAFCWAVEFSQLYHSPMIDGWRQTTLGGLVLGSGFDPRDLGWYAIGVLATVAIQAKSRHFR